MKNINLFVVLIMMSVLTINSTSSRAATYQVDKDHTLVSFKIRNFISNVQGSFHDFQGWVSYDADKPETWTSSGTIEVKSIDTKNSERDHHLLSKDFFDAEKFPAISFKTVKVSLMPGSGARVEGLLIVHGVERPVLLDVRDLAPKQGPNGKEHLTFTATAKINRKDFGIVYSGAPGIGNVMLGDDVMIVLQVDAILE